MNFVQEDQKGYCNNEDEEDDDEEVIKEISSNFPFSSSSSSTVSSKYTIPQQNQNLWLGLGPLDNSQTDYNKTEEPDLNFDKKLELMDLSLGNNNNNEESNIIGSCNDHGSMAIEKEHMFDKVVTPSDVGKLNRLVIPKQHAKKHFPLDSSSIEKGLLLNFEDRNGKSWRFRYSYWNSSQSYVMTKGWSRFVKEKKLVAGDIVSFQRGLGESLKDRLFIDWRRRPNALDPTSLAHIQLQNQLNFPQAALRWGRLYSLPQPVCVSQNYEPLHRLNYSIYPYNHHHQQQLHQQQQQLQHQAIYGHVSQYYQIGALQGGSVEPMVIDSVPDVELEGNKTAAKRLRLFGVNMDCPNPTQDESSSSSIRPRLSNDNNNNTSLSAMQAEYSKKGKSSLSIDLEL